MSRALKLNEVFNNLDNSDAAGQIISVLKALRIFAKSAGLTNLEQSLGELTSKTAENVHSLHQSDFIKNANGWDLIASVKATTRVHGKVLLKIIDQRDAPLDHLIGLMEDVGNDYMDYSQMIGKKLFGQI